MDFRFNPDFVMNKTYLGSKELEGEESSEESLEELAQMAKAKEVAITFAEYFETKGVLKGRQEGHVEAPLEMARRLMAKGMPVTKNAELTGLSVEEVRRP